MSRYIFGVAGEMGTGKSYCLSVMGQAFKGFDIPFRYIKVDDLRRHILRVSNEPAHKMARQKMAKSLGLDARGPKFYIKPLDLAAKIFADESKMEVYKKAVSPLIRQEVVRQSDSEGVVALEWAMLIEDGFLPLVDGNVLILTCSREVQLSRLKRTQDIPDDQLSQRIDFQRSLDKGRLSVAQTQGKMVKVFDTTDNPCKDIYEKLVQEIIEKIGFKNDKNIYKK